eukprot:scaffold16259_cov59-Phaeocystis_antarctica.AAC.1
MVGLRCSSAAPGPRGVACWAQPAFSPQTIGLPLHEKRSRVVNAVGPGPGTVFRITIPYTYF